MRIRKATMADLDKIMPIYDRARVFMAENHNPKQWGDGYPQREIIEADIQQGHFYLCIGQNSWMKSEVVREQETSVEQEEIYGAFALIFGEDPTYALIDGGAWLSEKAYATIHRLASAGIVCGVAEACFLWCKNQCDSIRIDTHMDNAIMQHVIRKAGFVKCGIIYVRDGTPRLAFQWEK